MIGQAADALFVFERETASRGQADSLDTTIDPVEAGDEQ